MNILKSLLRNFVTCLEHIIEHEILFIKRKERQMAVLSPFGFWYVGNAFDRSDIAYGITQNNYVEKEEVELTIFLLKKIIEKESKITMYDIGAHTGYYSTVASYLYNDNIHIEAFEPIKMYSDQFKLTIGLNNLKNINLNTIALGNTIGQQIIHQAGSGSSLNKTFAPKQTYGTELIMVDTMDHIIKIKNYNDPDFIKIDVESYEYNVLQGGNEMIKRAKPAVFVEIIYSTKELSTFINIHYESIFEYMYKCGYAAYRIINGKLIPVVGIEKIFGIFMYLFLHKEKHEYIIEQLTYEKLH